MNYGQENDESIVLKTIIGFVKFFVMDFDITDIAVVDLVERI